jgi:purine-binding chemotaxis protein CheW
LFREDVMRRIGDTSLHSVLQPTATPGDADLHFVVFRLGDEEFGLPIAAVDEVARVPTQITRVPKMPDFLEGVVNLRGDVLPVVDQRRRFDMPRLARDGRQRLIVVRAERHRVNGVINDRRVNRMILLLDPSELLTPVEQSALDQLEPGNGDETVRNL